MHPCQFATGSHSCTHAPVFSPFSEGCLMIDDAPSSSVDNQIAIPLGPVESFDAGESLPYFDLN